MSKNDKIPFIKNKVIDKEKFKDKLGCRHTEMKYAFSPHNYVLLRKCNKSEKGEYTYTSRSA